MHAGVPKVLIKINKAHVRTLTIFAKCKLSFDHGALVEAVGREQSIQDRFSLKDVTLSSYGNLAVW